MKQNIKYLGLNQFKDIAGFLGGTSGQEPSSNAGDLEMRVRSLGWEDPLEIGMQPIPVFLPREQWREEPGGLQSIGS